MIKLKFSPQEAIAEAANNLTKAFLIANGSDEQTATIFGATLSGAIKGIGIEQRRPILNGLDLAIKKAWTHILSKEVFDQLGEECKYELTQNVISSQEVFKALSGNDPVSALRIKVIFILRKYTDLEGAILNDYARYIAEQLIIFIDEEIKYDGILTLLQEIELLRRDMSTKDGTLESVLLTLFQNVVKRLDNISVTISSLQDDRLVIQKTEIHQQNTPLYRRLMERFRYIKEQHPSIRMMTVNPTLFRNDIPAFNNNERLVIRENEKPITIKSMVQRSWADPFHKHILLIGEGGIGKTVSMLTLPEENWVKKLQIPAVYISLQSITAYRGNLNNHIRDIYGDDADYVFNLASNPWKEHPHLFLLLDGFNEVPEQYRKTLENYIHMWMSKPGVQLITTSRINFILPGGFLVYKLLPLSKDIICSHLLNCGILEESFPEDNNIWDIISIPLMLNLYLQIDTELLQIELGREPTPEEVADKMDIPVEVVRERIKVTSLLHEDIGKYYLLDWRRINSVSSIIWNYLQLEIAHCVEETVDVQFQMEVVTSFLAVAPYICFKMIKNNSMFLTKEEFKEMIKESCQFYKGHAELLFQQVHIIKAYIDEFDEDSVIEEKYWLDYAKILTSRSALFQRKIITQRTSRQERIIEVVYVPAHQIFRDVIASFFISAYMDFSELRLEWNYNDYYKESLFLRFRANPNGGIIIDGTADSKDFSLELDVEKKEDILKSLITIINTATVYDFDEYFPDIWILIDAYGNELQRGSSFHPQFIEFLEFMHNIGVPISSADNNLFNNISPYF